MELAEREGQAGRLRREPGNDEGSGETRNEPPLRADRNGLLLLPPFCRRLDAEGSDIYHI